MIGDWLSRSRKPSGRVCLARFAPEPPPSATAVRPSPPPTRSMPRNKFILGLLILLALGSFYVLLFSFVVEDLVFKVQSVSVSLYNNVSSQTMAEWNISFSVWNPNILNNVQIRDSVNVSVRCLSMNPTGTVLPGFDHGPPDLFLQWSGSTNVTIKTTLPVLFINAMDVVLHFDVNVQTKMKYSNGLKSGIRLINVTSRGLKVGFQSGTSYGTMLGKQPVKCLGQNKYERVQDWAMWEYGVQI